MDMVIGIPCVYQSDRHPTQSGQHKQTVKTVGLVLGSFAITYPPKAAVVMNVRVKIALISQTIRFTPLV